MWNLDTASTPEANLFNKYPSREYKGKCISENTVTVGGVSLYGWSPV